MNTVQLKYFIAVAETLSFTQAARELFVAQTAISQQIASLERELDVTLFTRTSWSGLRSKPSSMKLERQDF